MNRFFGLAFPIVISIMLAEFIPVASDYVYFTGGFFACALFNYATGDLKFVRVRAR